MLSGTFPDIFSLPVGHSFVRKWMLLTNPEDKGADEENEVRVISFGLLSVRKSVKQ